MSKLEDLKVTRRVLADRSDRKGVQEIDAQIEVLEAAEANTIAVKEAVKEIKKTPVPKIAFGNKKKKKK
jgi:hypothetical protein